MNFWKKLTHEERKARIEKALHDNVNFSKDASLGYPASKLDSRVFYDDAPFLKDAPTLQTYLGRCPSVAEMKALTKDTAIKIYKKLLHFVYKDGILRTSKQPLIWPFFVRAFFFLPFLEI